MPIVCCSNLWKWYQSPGGKLDVIKGLDFELLEGEFVSIVGASGVGKSTFLHIIGLLDLPSDGTLIFDGKNISGLSDAVLASSRMKKVGFVFQFHHLLPEFTALENVMLPQKILGISRKQAKNRAEELLSTFGILDRANHFPCQLSGGEAQRVALARALANSPQIILADEPTGNLDSENAHKFMRVISELKKDNGISMVLATHNMEIAQYADRILRLKDGKLHEIEKNNSYIKFK